MKRKLNKTEKVYNSLSNDIIEGKLYPGQRLIEKELINKYGISKTPIREALSKSEKLGLVQKIFNQGFTVKKITKKDAEELYDLREVLEGFAARKVVERISSYEIEKLKRIIDKFEEYIKKNDIKSYAKDDVNFHSFLGQISGNRRLCEMMKSLYCQSRILLNTSLVLPERGMKISISEHKKIINAIINHDSEQAEIYAKEHIANTRNAILKWFDTIGSKF